MIEPWSLNDPHALLQLCKADDWAGAEDKCCYSVGSLPTSSCIFTNLEQPFHHISAKVASDGKILIHFDGWTDRYDYWTEPTSVDLHPIGWMQNFPAKQNVLSKMNSDGTPAKYHKQLQKPYGM